jgi:hypothetical protein
MSDRELIDEYQKIVGISYGKFDEHIEKLIKDLFNKEEILDEVRHSFMLGVNTFFEELLEKDDFYRKLIDCLAEKILENKSIKITIEKEKP